MPSVTIKDLPKDLHGQLKREAEANFRSLNQEVLARLQRSLDFDEKSTTGRDQAWIDQALASGPASALTEKEMDSVRDRILRRKHH